MGVQDGGGDRGWKRPEQNEDVEVERPSVGSSMEKAISLAHGRVETREGRLATVVQVVCRGRKVPKYKAIVGDAEEIELVPPTHSDMLDEDKELRRLVAGDTVLVRERVEGTFSGIKVSWVMVKRVRRESDWGAPKMQGGARDR